MTCSCCFNGPLLPGASSPCAGRDCLLRRDSLRSHAEPLIARASPAVPFQERIGGAAHLFAQVTNGLTLSAVSQAQPPALGTFQSEEGRRGGGRGDVDFCVWGLRRGSAAHGEEMTTKLLFIAERAQDACLPSVSLPPRLLIPGQVGAGGQDSFSGWTFMPTLTSFTC